MTSHRAPASPGWLGNGTLIASHTLPGGEDIKRLGIEYTGKRLLELWSNSPAGDRQDVTQLPSYPVDTKKSRTRQRPLVIDRHRVSSHAWRFVPPVRSSERFSSLLPAPKRMPLTKTYPLPPQPGAASNPHVVMLVSRRENDSAQCVLSLYNGVADKILCARVCAPPGVILHPAERTAVKTDAAGSQFLVLEVLPGETTAYYSCLCDSVPKPSWVLNVIPRSASALVLKTVKEIAKRDHNRVAAAAAGVLQSEHPEKAVIRRCHEKRIPFVDLWFPPSKAGVSTDAWARPQSSIYAREQLCSTMPSPHNLERGPVGCANLLCALAILAEFPSGQSAVNFVARMFEAHTQALTEMGCVSVHLSVGGWWREVVVDTFLPVTQVPGHLLLLPSGIRPIVDVTDLWAAFVEKAYAKELGGYASIALQSRHELLTDLTGFPSEPLRWARHESAALFSDLIEWNRRNCIISLHTPLRARRAGEQPGPNDDLYEAAGLLTGHMYAVLQAVQVGTVRLLHVRNPWCKGVKWMGEWAWDSPRWTPEMRHACGIPETPSSALDCTMMLTWEEAQRWFEGGTVTYCSANAGEARISLPMTPSPAFVVEVTLQTAARLYVSVQRLQQDRLRRQTSSSIVVSLLEPTNIQGRYTCREDVEHQHSEGYGRVPVLLPTHLRRQSNPQLPHGGLRAGGFPKPFLHLCAQ
eukprot:Rhum_TRINITY_DN8168_c0_g1::Rhum_TRINITY_DN8168_c0_g1_i4::g.26543::m.26543/K08582/CAPN15; calpain-15